MIAILETRDQVQAIILHDMLNENGIKCEISEVSLRTAGKHTGLVSKRYDVYVKNEDEASAREIIRAKGEFDDMPWDPDSDSLDPEPRYPWYMDSRNKRKILWISWIILFIFILYIVIS